MQMFTWSGGDCTGGAPRGMKLTTESGDIIALGDTGDTRDPCEEHTVEGNITGWNFENVNTMDFLQPILSFDYVGVVATRDATIATM
jgi:hypothetical protein